MSDEQIRIYYDGECRLCNTLVHSIESSSQARVFSPNKIQESLPEGVNFAEADRDVHTVDTRGRMLKGSEAVLYILSYYPQWRWLSYIGSLPGFKQLGKGIYRVIASNRKRWF